jgi:hypothetical protein
MEDFRLEGPACALKREAEKDWGSKRCLLRCDRLASHRRLTNTLWIYTVCSGEWPVGRIYEERGSAQDQRWFWSLFGIL